MSELSCARLHELAPELALDVLTGDERATARAHLGSCPRCREYVSLLAQTGDRLLALVPGVEPPVGFEDRALARLRLRVAREPRSRPRRWRSMALAAAVIAAVVFGTVGGAVAGLIGHPPVSAEAEIRFAQLRGGDQRPLGQVLAYGGTPSWVYMSVTGAVATS